MPQVPVTVRIPMPVMAWPSGLVTVTFLAPGVAPIVRRFSVTWVGETKVTEFTATPPVTAAAMRFAKPGPPGSGPGSKNSEPATDVPVMVTLTDGRPWLTEAGLAVAGVAGPGGRSWMALKPQVFRALAYSWKVHIV